MNNNSTILLFIHTEENKIHNIEVQENDPIKIIDQKLHSPISLLLFFNNNILIKTFSFKFYGISSGDHIYATKSQSLHAYSNFTKAISKNLENGLKRFSNIKNEASKLRDLIVQKIDDSSSSFRAFNKQISNNDTNKNSHFSPRFSHKIPIEISC